MGTAADYCGDALLEQEIKIRDVTRAGRPCLDFDAAGKIERARR
jgi:hypothetical protein